MFRKLRNYFFSGLLVVVPIGITVWIVLGIFNLLDSWYHPLIIKLKLDNNPLHQYGVGFILVILLICFIGSMTQLYIGRKLLTLVEYIFLHIPGISNIYNGLKQVTETLMGRRHKIFESVVLIEYPRKGLYSLAFLTARDDHLIKPIIGKPLVYVFIATTPNPTSGIFLIVPEDEITPLDIGVEDAMKMIISSGMVAPKKIAEIPLEALPAHLLETNIQNGQISEENEQS